MDAETKERRRLLETLKQGLLKSESPRTTMFLFVLATGGSGFAFSWILLHLGLANMGIRYALSVLGACTSLDERTRLAIYRPTRTVPADFDSTCEATAARDAAPPTWKVRMVSCVPGSPIDCAAITPTDSPALTMLPRPRSRP